MAQTKREVKLKPSFVKIVHNPIVAKVITSDDEVRHLCSEILSYKVAGSEQMKISSWDGYSSFFSMRNNQFPAGFVRLVKKRLERHGHKVIVKSKPAPEPKGEVNPKVDDFPSDPRYDYQNEVKDRLVIYKNMIAQVATGGGKSRCFKLCERRLALPTLFLTTRKSLMYQMAEVYEKDLKRPVGILGDGKWSPIKNGVNFAIVDTLSSRLEVYDIDKEIEVKLEKHSMMIEEKIADALKKLNLPTNLSSTRNAFVPQELKDKISKVRAFIVKKNPIDSKALRLSIEQKAKVQEKKRNEALALLREIGFLCLEEAHEVSGGGFFTIAQACVNAHYRLALTATPFMKDDEEANMKLMAVTGQIGIKVSEKLLIDREILSKPYFKLLESSRPEKLYRGTAWQRAYKIGIVENEDRNKKIAKEVFRAHQYGLTSMILVQHQNHGKILLEMLSKIGVRSRFISGKDEQKERKQAFDDLKSGKITCLIGSTILDVGVDVPSVGLVVLAGGGKAEVAQRQRIGRGLRAKSKGPNVCLVVDFRDVHNNHLLSHSNERIRIIEETKGFGENIVKDFDYEKLGFKKSHYTNQEEIK